MPPRIEPMLRQLQLSRPWVWYRHDILGGRIRRRLFEKGMAHLEGKHALPFVLRPACGLPAGP